VISAIEFMFFRCIVVRCRTLIYQVHIMGYVPSVGFATHRRATVRIHLHFKRLMFKKTICIKKKKKGSSHKLRKMLSSR